MQLDAQSALPVFEAAGALAFVDIECSNLKADFGTAVVVSVRPYKGKPKTFSAKPGNDKKLLQAVHAEMSKYPLWCTFYGKMFDIPFLNSRMLVNGLVPLPKHHHCDLYWVIKGQTALSRRNQAHLLEWLRTPEKKMSVSPNVWAEMAAQPTESLKILRQRCESDVEGLEALYDKTKHLIRDICR